MIDLIVGIDRYASGLQESTDSPDHGEHQGLGCLSLGAGIRASIRPWDSAGLRLPVRQYKRDRGSDLVEELVAAASAVFFVNARVADQNLEQLEDTVVHRSMAFDYG